MSQVKVVRVVVVDDNEPDVARVRQVIGDAASNLGVSWEVEVDWSRFRRGESGWDQHAQWITGKNPNIVLSDAVLDGSLYDGPALLEALCCREGYAGFAYIWTSADPEKADELRRRHAPLLTSVGSGCFSSKEPAALAHAIADHYSTCGDQFRLNEPELRCFNPLDAALDLLSDLLFLCLEPNCPERATLLNGFRKAIGGFVLQVKRLDGANKETVRIHLNQASEEALALYQMTEHQSTTDGVMASVSSLRDSLLAVCDQLGYQ